MTHMEFVNNRGFTTISFPGIGITVNPSSGITIGSFHIAWYGVIIACGLALAILYCCRRSKEFGIKEDDILDGVLWIVPVAIICARLYYCLFYQNSQGVNPYFEDPSKILSIRDGGLAIYGGVIGAVLCVLLWCKIKKVNVFAILDLVVLGFLIGQSIGRWGNFFNREAFGAPTNSWLRMGLTDAVTGVTVYYHPTFLYESLWNCVGFIALHLISKHRKYDGQITLGYLFWYGLGRSWIEGLRTDSLYHTFFGVQLRVSQVLSIGMCVVGAVGLIVMAIRKPDPDKRFVCRVAAQAEVSQDPDLTEEQTESTEE